MYKLCFYVPESHTEAVKTAVFAAGAGRIGNYDCCAWQIKGEGQFRPLAGSNAFIGTENSLEKVVECKVELICPDEKIDKVISALKKAHPYETPAFQAWQIEIF